MTRAETDVVGVVCRGMNKYVPKVLRAMEGCNRKNIESTNGVESKGDEESHGNYLLMPYANLLMVPRCLDQAWSPLIELNIFNSMGPLS
ncbi:hypothetical protein PoB_004017300 [Plakobranchus ocellatus]|uniref:Uncharacterized protein n=1 Tax=Plakobranchus ocellatus TaxID=259542 RepID=A0AAV4B3I6_9GAST|nr:hypothetical protein PoB_004017300 [Plakobranchus ocellatus]